MLSECPTGCVGVRTYLADLSKTCGFEICEVSEIIHEQSSTQKIPGFVAVLRKKNGVEGP